MYKTRPINVRWKSSNDRRPHPVTRGHVESRVGLDSNFIDSRGVEKLCETLTTREVAVKEVYLGKNFDVQEAEASLEMLQQAKQLQFLDIGEIDADTAESLSYLLQNNPALHYQIKNI